MTELFEPLSQEQLRQLPVDLRDYFLRRLPAHLVDADLYESLHHVLTDLNFIEAKCSAGLTYELLNDYLSIAEKIDTGCFSETDQTQLQEFTQFIRNQSRILSTHPSLTFQQSANQPPGTAPSVTAIQYWKTGSEPRQWLRVIFREASSHSALISFRTPKRPVAASISSSGKRIAICDGDVWVFNIHSGREIFHLTANLEKSFSTVALSPDGNHLAVVEKTNYRSDRLLIWGIEDGARIEVSENPVTNILALRFSSTGKLLAVGGKDGNSGALAVFNIAAKNFLWKQIIQRTIVRKVIFLPGDQTTVAGQGNGICSFWNVATGELKKILQAHSGAVTDLCVSRNGKLLATSSQDRTCQIIPIFKPQDTSRNLQSKIPFSDEPHNRTIFSAHQATPSSVCFLDDVRLISGDVAGFCHIWNAMDGRLESSPISGEGKILSVELSGNQEFLLVTSVDDHMEQVFETKMFSKPDTSQFNQVRFMCFLENFIELALARQDGGFEFYSVKDRKIHKTYNLPGKTNVKSLVVSSGGRFILSIGSEHNWEIWDHETQSKVNGTYDIAVGNDVVSCISSDGQFICLFSQEHLEFISVKGGRQTPVRLPMIVGAMRFLTSSKLEIVGTNLSLHSFQAEDVVYLQAEPSRQLSGAVYSGPFGENPMRGSSNFQFAAPDTFVQSSTRMNGNGVVAIWDTKINCLGMREFSTPVKVHEVTLDGKWILLSEPSTSTCYILDATTQNLQIVWSYPLLGGLISGAIQENGELVAFAYRQGGMEIAQRLRR